MGRSKRTDEIRVLVTGSATVGKTSLLTRFKVGVNPWSKALTWRANENHFTTKSENFGDFFITILYTTLRKLSPTSLATKGSRNNFLATFDGLCIQNGVFFDGYSPTEVRQCMNVRKDVLSLRRPISFRLIDSAGQARDRRVTNANYLGIDAVVFVYDVTNKESFVELKGWLEDVDIFCDHSVSRIIVGNKCDRVEDRVVDTTVAKDLALRHGTAYAEASAKTGENVDELFMNLTLDITKSV